jgi:hypothetical protein
MEILGLSTDYGKGQKRRQISFRIGAVCLERLEKVAELFNMTASQYAKAILYREMQVFSESPDNRRRVKKKKLKKVETKDPGELQE